MKFIYSALIFLVFVVSMSAQTSYIYCGALLTMENSTVHKEKTIVVEGQRISQILAGYAQAPDSVTIIDLRDKFVMPGFMDMHVHIEHESSPTRYLDRFRKNKSDIALGAIKYCSRTLMAGFTTVRDLGGTGVNVSLRDAINAGEIEAGGHADPTNGLREDLKGDPGPAEGVINSIEDAKKAVRQRYKNGADCIKITATGGVLSVAKDGQGPQFTVDEVKAVVDAAADYGYTTAAHAHGAEGMKRAVLGGIHSIEHGTKMTKEVMNLMIEKGTYYVPTISAGKFVEEKAKIPGYYPKIIVPKALEIGPLIQETFGKAYKHGVKIAFGTDAGVSPHGDNAKEFIFMTEAGMPNYEALKAATVNAADLMNKSEELGTITVGKQADIIALEGNPLEEIERTLVVPFVMKSGVVYKE